MHKAMRADSQRLIRAVDTLPDGDIQHAAALGRAFAAIAGPIHDHHWTEDDVMYPFLLDGYAPSRTTPCGCQPASSSAKR